jgi:flagellar L-ring protein precursor FlgH
MFSRGIMALAAAWTMGGIAMAQTAPEPARTQPRETKRQNTPPVVSTNNTAEQAASMVQQNNGSLLAAQLASHPDPSQVKPAQVSFFAVSEPEPRTLKVHDLVQIIVQEKSDITSKGTKNTSRDSELDAKVNNFVKLSLSNLTLKGLTPPTATPEVNLSGTRSFQGSGEVDRSDSFTARITAEVLDVKPNGTLVLQARKRIKTDEEEQQFILTGICRVEDLAADNTILSTQLFDLELQKNHKGDVRDATKQGFIGKLLDVVNPF